MCLCLVAPCQRRIDTRPISQVVLGKAKALARSFLEEGRSETFDDNPLPYGEIQALFANLAVK